MTDNNLRSRSEELAAQWQKHGGNLAEYRCQYHSDVTDSNGRATWTPSFVYRYRPTPAHNTRKTDPAEASALREQYRPPSDIITCDNCNTIQNVGTDTYHKLLWKHRRTDTWMHLKSSTSMIVGEEIGFKAYVTINGQHLTVGEYFTSTDPHEVFEWAREWMQDHPTVETLYD